MRYTHLYALEILKSELYLKRKNFLPDLNNVKFNMQDKRKIVYQSLEYKHNYP